MRIHTTITNKQSTKNRIPQADFDRVHKYSTLICDAFHKPLFNLEEQHLDCRLFWRVFNLLRSDKQYPAALGKITSDNLKLLEGFDFNKRKPLYRTFNGRYDVSINRNKGVCMLNIPAFDPVRDLRWEGRVTHIKILAAAAVLDFRSMKFLTTSEESGFLDVQQLTTTSLKLSFPARTRRPIVVVMGIEFYQFVGSRYFLRQQDGAKSLTIVKVSF
ncbi:hypothetical protein [Paraflavitalea soli]|nr:hypothetical protein [Paraflavitalea soli]